VMGQVLSLSLKITHGIRSFGLGNVVLRILRHIPRTSRVITALPTARFSGTCLIDDSRQMAEQADHVAALSGDIGR
jgi:hypothetical protein